MSAPEIEVNRQEEIVKLSDHQRAIDATTHTIALHNSYLMFKQHSFSSRDQIKVGKD